MHIDKVTISFGINRTYIIKLNAQHMSFTSEIEILVIM